MRVGWIQDLGFYSGVIHPESRALCGNLLYAGSNPTGHGPIPSDSAMRRGWSILARFNRACQRPCRSH
jgi:hypothetical protein